MPPKRHLVGQRYGRLVVLSEAGRDRFGRVTWLCRCDCGTSVERPGYYLTSGDTQSCGCLITEIRSERAKGWRTHRATGTPEFEAWSAMLQRCYNPRRKDYRNWGGRGITVCDPWRVSFARFLADMGERPGKGYSLDRINNDGNYEPGNCRWADQLTQQNNKRNILPEITVPGAKHGTWSGYHAGCRCADCRRYNTEKWLTYKAKKCMA